MAIQAVVSLLRIIKERNFQVATIEARKAVCLLETQLFGGLGNNYSASLSREVDKFMSFFLLYYVRWPLFFHNCILIWEPALWLFWCIKDSFATLPDNNASLIQSDVRKNVPSESAIWWSNYVYSSFANNYVYRTLWREISVPHNRWLWCPFHYWFYITIHNYDTLLVLCPSAP